MLSKVIVSSYSMLLEVAIWLILLGGLVGGWAEGGVAAAIGGLIVSFIVSVVFFGAFLALVDIQKSVREIKEQQGSPP